MKKPSKQQLWLAASCLVCSIVGFGSTYDLDGEFSGGWLTGPLLSANDTGTVLFLLAFVVTFIYPRIAGAIGLASSLLSLPLYLYFLAPLPFARIFGSRHQFSAQPSGGFHWNSWAILGILAIAITFYLCLRSFAITSRRP